MTLCQHGVQSGMSYECSACVTTPARVAAVTTLTLDVDTHVIYARESGRVLGEAWGPSADGDGNWFARWGDADGHRVASKDAAVRWLELRGGEQ